MLIEKKSNIWFAVKTSCSDFKYVNYTTGEQRSYAPDETQNIIIKDTLNNIFTIVGTDEENNLIVENAMLSDITAPIRGPKKREWVIVSTNVYDNRKRIVSKANYIEDIKANESKYPNSLHITYYNECWFFSPSFILINTNKNNPDCVQNHLKSVYGTYICNMAGNKSLIVNNSDSFLKFLKFSEPTPNTGKKQELINTLAALTTPLENIPVMKSYKRGCHCWDDNADGFAIVDKIEGYSEPCVCLRTFSVCGDDFNEGNRIYITKKDSIICKKTLTNGYVTATAQKSSYWMYPLVSIDKKACKGTMLEYFADICDNFNDKVKLLLLIVMVQNKWFEQLYKSGYTNIVHDFIFKMQNYSQTIKTFTDHYFYGVNNKEKKLTNIIGLSANQLKFFNEHINPNHILKTSSEYRYTKEEEDWAISDFRDNNDYKNFKTTSIRTFKLVMNEQNICHLDEKTFSKLFNFLTDVHLDECSYNYINNNVLATYVHNWGVQNLLAKEDIIKAIINKTKEFANSGTDYYSRYRNSAEILFRDYVNMVASQNFSRSFKVDFKDYEGLKKAHDAVSLVYEAVINVQKVEAFAKQTKKLEKFNYEESEFVVITPEKPEELAKEGLSLHHCVKSYIDKVCNGTTGIMFIREKAALDVPFFTAEVQNGTVMQIHGFANCNVSSNPKVEIFVNNWIKNKKLKVNVRSFDIVR